VFGSDAFRLDARAILSISQFTVLISVCYRLQISLWPHFHSDLISVAKMPSAAASGSLCKRQHLRTKGLIYPTALLRRSSTRRAEDLIATKSGATAGVKLIAFLNESIENYDETEDSSKSQAKIRGCPFTSNGQPSLATNSSFSGLHLLLTKGGGLC
jgi:hypothetical protein